MQKLRARVQTVWHKHCHSIIISVVFDRINQPFADPEELVPTKASSLTRMYTMKSFSSQNWKSKV